MNPFLFNSLAKGQHAPTSILTT